MIRRSLRALADKQCGYFTAQQAIGAGYIKRQHAYHTGCGNWLKVDRGVFRLPGYADTQESEFIRWSLWAVGRSPTRQVVISHESALHHYGLSATPPAVIHLTVPFRQQNREEQEGCVFHRQDLAATEIRSLPGYRITTPLRTLEDMKPELLLCSQWLHTVFLALKLELLSEPQAQDLAGPCLYQQERSGLRSLAAATALATHEWNPAVARKETTMRPYRALPNFTGQRSANRSFTLIEMLVVIAIISILASLLMPVLVKAQSEAYKVQCTANLKQLAVGEAMYGQTFGSWFSGPDNCFYSGSTAYLVRASNWETLVAAQIDPQVNDWTSYKKYYQYNSASFNGGGVMRCPEMRETRASGGIDTTARYNFLSYMMMGRANVTNNGMGDGLNGIRLGSVRSPSRTAMYLDGPGDALRCGSATTQYRFYPGISAGYSEQEIVTDLIEYAHNKTANVAMVDGHVQTEIFPAPTKTENPAFYNRP